MKKRTNEHIN